MPGFISCVMMSTLTVPTCTTGRNKKLHKTVGGSVRTNTFNGHAAKQRARSFSEVEVFHRGFESRSKGWC